MTSDKQEPKDKPTGKIDYEYLKGNQHAKGNKGGGHPMALSDKDKVRILKMIAAGLNNRQIAAVFDVCETTIYRYKKSAEFEQAVKDNESIAIQAVKHSLWQKATGYYHDDVHISNYQGDITITDIEKHIPASDSAIKYYLNNKDTENWREKFDFTHENINMPTAFIIKGEDGKKILELGVEENEVEKGDGH